MDIRPLHDRLIDGDDYLIMREDEVLALIETD
jgi:co-chaperonin GroES (HSP10)